jgi:hypothetical protein
MQKIFTLVFIVGSFVAQAQPFGAGNIVVYRAGDGAAALSANGTAIFLDEITPAGAFVRSIALPTTVVGSNKAILANGTSTTEGAMSRSSDGTVLVIGGYNGTLGAAVSTIASATINRSIAVVDGGGNVDVTTSLTDAHSTGNIRSVTSTNGLNIWTLGSNEGIRYCTKGANTSTLVSSTNTNNRCFAINNTNIFFTHGSGTTLNRIMELPGFPTAGPVTATGLTGIVIGTAPVNSYYQFILFDLSSAEPGLDVMYVASDVAGNVGIIKFSKVAGTWTSNGTMVSATDIFRGLTGEVSGTDVTLYATRKSVTGGQQELVSVRDVTGYNVAPVAAPVFTLLATAATNTTFRGVALAPTTALPIKLNFFNGALINNQVQLKWSTGFEGQLKNYEVEKSANGRYYASIKTITPQGNYTLNEYVAYDANVNTGTNYYRLKMTDKDGSVTFSRIVVFNTKASEAFVVYPNPGAANISLQHGKAVKGATIQVLSVDGKLIRNFAVEENANQTSLNVEQLIAGSYFIQFVNGAERKSVQFVKQ